MICGYPARAQSEDDPYIREAHSLLQQGLRSYQEQEYQEAYHLWREAEQVASDQQLPLREVLALSHQSLALQNLGRWREAGEAVDQSMALLTDLEGQSDLQTYREILAKVWNTKGQLAWIQGDYAQANQAWEESRRSYEQANQFVGSIRTQINRSKALQALGLNYRALQLLEQVRRSLEDYPDTDLKAKVLERLGLSFRQIGRLEQSREILMEGLDISEDRHVRSSILTELANTERYMADLEIERERLDKAEDLDRSAINHYQQAIGSNIGLETIRPQLNQLKLLLDKGEWSKAAKLAIEIYPLIDQLPPGRSSIEARLSWISTLTCLKQAIELDDPSCIGATRRQTLPRQFSVAASAEKLFSWTEIMTFLDKTSTLAQQIGDPISQSQVLGQIGYIYELRDQPQEAQVFSEQAILLLEDREAPETRYRWEWQLGRVLVQQGRREEAIGVYETAIDTLNRVRQNLITTSADIQFNFRDNVEPIYRELIELLVVDPTGVDPSSSSLEKVIELVDDIQLAELENFLRCALVFPDSTNRGPTPRDDANAAFVYPVVLDDRILVISKIPGQEIDYHQMLIDQLDLQEKVNSIQNAILHRDGGRVTTLGEELYKGLIRPLEARLALTASLETVVFVLDRDLRNIPMSALYDAENNQYLVEKPYSTAVLPTARLFNQQVKRRSIEVLAGGVSLPLRADELDFSPLDVESELRQILTEVQGEMLLDRELTQSNLQDTLNRNTYSVLHLATHGSFSSVPEDTYILIHSEEEEKGQLLRPDDFERLLNTDRQDSSVLDLLVLSACETAEGNDRAPLGLAGIAIRSGARSTVATLWQVSDESTVDFMSEFYKLISQPDMTLSQAIQKSQLSLLDNPRYQNPYYWSPYVLVGNWR